MQGKLLPFAVLALILAASGPIPRAKAQSEDRCQRIPAMIQALESEEPEVRLRAVQELAESVWMNREVQDALRGVLGDPERMVRLEAAIALQDGDIEGSPAIPILVDAFPQETGQLQERIAEALGHFGRCARYAVPALIKALEEGRGNIRRKAADALRSIGPDAVEAVPALIQAIREEGHDERLRFDAICALSWIGPAAAESVPTLTAVLENPDSTCRANAAQALGEIGPAAAPSIPALAAALNHAYRERDEILLGAAALALADVGPVGHDRLMEAMSQNEQPFVAAVARGVCRYGASGYLMLGEALRDEIVGPRLAKVLPDVGEEGREAGIWILVRGMQGDDDFARGLAVEVLAGLESQADVVVRTIQQHLDRCRGAAKYASIELLGRFGPKAGRGWLELWGFLENTSDPHGRVLAARALGRFGSAAEPALPRLQLMSDCEDPEIREAATEAVERILAACGERAPK